MAVFTTIEPDQLDQWLAPLHVGTLISFEGIASGIENTNYFVDTTQGRWVLTLFERLTPEQLPFYLELMRHLAQHGLRVPAPQADPQGRLMRPLAGKPAALVTRLKGRATTTPTASQCRTIGENLARAHLAGQDYPLQQPNLRGLSWWQQTVPGLLQFLDTDLAAMLTDELQTQSLFAQSATYQTLPRGPVHADLFRDNVLFDGDELGGFIDFYFAGCDAWMFDLAVTANDWCLAGLPSNQDGRFEPTHLQALLDGYRSVRQPTADEVQAWPLMLRAAALRFWVSRLFDFYRPRPAEVLTPHDPTHFERVLRDRRSHAYSMAA